MKLHKRWIIPPLMFAVCATIVLATVLATPHFQTAVAGAEVAPGPLPGIATSADFAVKYSNLDQLQKGAAAVVRGEVTGVSYLDFNSTAYTVTTFRVAGCLKGNIKVGDEVTIVEVGGVTSVATVNGDKFGPTTDQDVATKVSVLLEGAPLTEVGDKCLYFLGVGSIGVVPGTYYVPLGSFQGRFKIENAVAQRYVPAGWGEEYTSLAIAENAIDQVVLGASGDE